MNLTAAFLARTASRTWARGIDTLTTNEPAHVLGWFMQPISYARHRVLFDALALELATCQRGHSAAFNEGARIHEARDERRLRALQKRLNTVKLLIVDELGYVPPALDGFKLDV